MSKKDKPQKNGKAKLEKKLAGLEGDIAKSRKKMLKTYAKLGKMNDVQDYILKDKYGTDVKLSEMFGDKSELILVHNMGRSCSYCTLWADGFNGVFYFIERKASFVLVSPDQPDVQKEFAEKRGWKFRMYSGADSAFIKDMGYQTEKGDYWPGASVFQKSADGKIIRISKTFFGPGDFFCSPFHFFDMLPQSENSVE